MNVLIVNPRGHRVAWAKAHPQAMIENGGLLSPEDLKRWACDICMAPLDVDAPIFCQGGHEGKSLCKACIEKLPEHDKIVDELCSCVACKLTNEQKAAFVIMAKRQNLVRKRPT